ncbi:hypothetical protein DENSPDRAFT_59383 [Dentipellis sp. KUC8613]|nr:hypothetical protein DENSPDRAFT_59383 [Dentipellis sp. KUC8613]
MIPNSNPNMKYLQLTHLRSFLPSSTATTRTPSSSPSSSSSFGIRTPLATTIPPIDAHSSFGAKMKKRLTHPRARTLTLALALASASSSFFASFPWPASASASPSPLASAPSSPSAPSPGVRTLAPTSSVCIIQIPHIQIPHIQIPHTQAQAPASRIPLPLPCQRRCTDSERNDHDEITRCALTTIEVAFTALTASECCVRAFMHRCDVQM